MKIGAVYHGFTLDSIEPVEELNIQAYRFRHIYSDARLLWLSCEDTNRAFSISFKTLPSDNTGVFHILEHSVLCGSRKYPLREPFVDLLKGSMQTFLNAMTFPDKTMYPVASTNEKDFVNLMDVYMDAVLYPRIHSTEEIFMQEGWHLEPPADEYAGAISGVVYNEMKGSYSSPDSVFYHTVQSAMLPNTCYAYSSGGDPAYIPDLTYDAFKKAHRKYYHPENSYIYLYGKMDIEEKLKFLDEKYLSNFKKKGSVIHVEWQKPLGERDVHDYYEVGSEEETHHNTYLAKSISLCDYNQRKTLLGMRTLLSALTSSNEAPLTRAMMDAKLGDDFSAWVDDGIMQPYITFRLKKADAASKDVFTRVLNDTLRELAEKGIDKSLLEASLNRFAFELREMDLGLAPGVALSMTVMETWLYGGNPVETLKNRKILDDLRRGIQNGYFEKLIARFLLAPDHSVTLVLEPSANLAEARLKKESERTSALCRKLGEDGLVKYKEKLQKFEAFQSTEDSKETRDLLPHLERTDLREEISHTDYNDECILGVKTRFYNLSANGISYLWLYFDTSAVPREDWKYLSLLSRVLFECSTKEHDALTYQNMIMRDMGVLSACVGGYTEVDGARAFRPQFTVSASFLEENYTKAKSLIEEGLLRSVFTEEQLKKLIKQIYVAKEGELIRNGHSFAALRAGSGTIEARAYDDETRGYGFYMFLKDLCDDIDVKLPGVIQKLSSLLESIFDRDLLTISMIMKDTYRADYIQSPIEIPARGGVGNVSFVLDKHDVSEGIKIPGAVAYNAIVGDYFRAGYQMSGTMNVLSRIISLDYLWNRVRMKGGAYGCNCTIQTNGSFALASYRDPHVKNTYQTYQSLPDYLRNFDVDESEMTKYVIGAFSILDQPHRAWIEALQCDDRLFSHVTDEMRQKIRSETLHVTPEDIRAAAGMVEAILNNASICTIGAADKIDGAKDMFRTINQ